MKNFFLNRIVIAVLMLTVGLAEGWWLGNRQGFVQGVDFLFNQCYNVGGVVLDERHGKAYAMLCGPLGEFPKEELPPLDKKEDMWYNKTINSI
jgi:hypothetical protein